MSASPWVRRPSTSKERCARGMRRAEGTEGTQKDPGYRACAPEKTFGFAEDCGREAREEVENLLVREDSTRGVLMDSPRVESGVELSFGWTPRALVQERPEFDGIVRTTAQQTSPPRRSRVPATQRMLVRGNCRH